MKFLVLSMFLSVMAATPALANLCKQPAGICKAMSCECGICSRCSGANEKKACEAMLARDRAESEEYNACLAEQKETGTKSLSLDKGENEGEDEGEEN